MNVEHKVDSEDFERLQKFLEEYTTKLQQACELKARDNDRQNRRSTLAILGAFINFVLIIGISILLGDVPVSSDYRTILFSMYSFLSLFVLFVLFMLRLWRNITSVKITDIIFGNSLEERKKQISAQVLAKSLEKIIKLASQYSEHAMNHIGNKFEFDIRVAEAEATLQMYYDFFK